MGHDGIPLSNYDPDILTQIEWGGHGTFTSNPDLFWEIYKKALEDSAHGLVTSENQTAIVAMTAAEVGCPVPGKVIDRKIVALKPDDRETDAWKETAKGYVTVKFIWEYLVHSLQNRGEKNREQKLDFLLGKIERTPGDSRTPNWPVESHEEKFNTAIEGVGNYISYVIPRIIRDAGPNLYLQLIDLFLEIGNFDDEVDLILQFGNKAVEIGADPNMIIKHAASKGFLVGENNLNDLYQQILSAIESSKYPLLSISEN